MQTIPPNDPGRARPATAARYQVPNLDRALSVLELLAQHPGGLTITEIVRRLDVSKTTVFRIAQTLAARGYLLHDEDTRRYRLSARLLQLGYAAVSETNLLDQALDVMRQARDELKETVLLGTIVGDNLVVLEQVLGLHPFKFMVDVGMHSPLHSNAPGKCLLALLPAGQRADLLAGMTLRRYTGRTMTDPEALELELDFVARHGYAIDRGEQIDGVHCVAAPVFDRRGCPAAALWVTGPSDRLPESAFAAVAEVMRRHAGRISQRLGFVER